MRIVLATCPAYIGSPPLRDGLDAAAWSPRRAYARSKLALMVFGRAFQKHLDAAERPDGVPNNAHVVFADPGYARTAGMTRWLTRGSVLGLLVYLLLYPLAWLLLKSADMASQSVLFAAMESRLAREPGGQLVKECIEVDPARKDIDDEAVAKELWEASDQLVEKTEKADAQKRARAKKAQEKRDAEKREADQVREVEALVDAIKKGKAQEKEPDAGQKTRARRKKKADGTAAR